jgi:hypothetical protein
MSFKIHLSLLSLVLLLASCALLMPAEKRQCYRTLKDFADEHWKFKDTLLIESNELFRAANSKKIDSCVKKMSKKDIKQIFGKPHEIVVTRSNVTQYYYFMFEACYPISEAIYCKYYAFDFNSEGACIGFVSGAVEKSH